MLQTYTRVHTDGELSIYDQGGDPAGTHQLWIYCTFDLPRILPAKLLLSVLSFLAPEDPKPVEGFSVKQVQNCFRMCSNARYIFSYIKHLEDQVSSMEAVIGVYPPSFSEQVTPGVYRFGSLFFSRVKNWVHISSSKELIQLAKEGLLSKADMPGNVKSFSSARGWETRVSRYLAEHK